MLPVAQAQDLSMAQAAQSLEQSAQRQQAQQPPLPGTQEPAQSAVQGAQAQPGASPRAALALSPSGAVRAVPGAARYNPWFKPYS